MIFLVLFFLLAEKHIYIFTTTKTVNGTIKPFFTDEEKKEIKNYSVIYPDFNNPSYCFVILTSSIPALNNKKVSKLILLGNTKIKGNDKMSEKEIKKSLEKWLSE